MFGFFKKKQPSPNDLTHQVANSVSSLLSAQLMMCQSSNKIGDNWTIGYIGGFIDQVNIRKGIKHDERGIGVMLLVFGSMFGDKNRVAYFNQYESLILSEDVKALEGDKIARNEAVALLNGSAQRAMGLSSYCLDMLDNYIEMLDQK